MAKRSKNSSQWLKEHFADPYVQRAQAEGWRSRAVFKLEEIDRKERLLKPGTVCVDLGAAPRGLEPVRASQGRPQGPGAGDGHPGDAWGYRGGFRAGDFREEAVVDALLARVPGRAVDVLLSDMAANLSGVDVIDAPRSMYLAELALDMAGNVLKPGGSALIKVFQGAGFEEFVRAARVRFGKVKLLKPEASRSRSPEMYLLAMQFRLV